MRANSIKIGVIIAGLFLLLTPSPGQMSLGRAYLALDKSTFLDPEIVKFGVVMEAPQPFNAVDLALQYEPQYLMLDQIATSSVCSLLIEKSIDNKAGQARLQCGSPAAQATSSARIAELTFRKVQAGGTRLAISRSDLYLHDGSGTRITNQSEVLELQIIKP